MVQQLRKHIAENEKLIDEQENKLLAKNADLEVLKQELMVAGGDYDAVQQELVVMHHTLHYQIIMV